MSEGREASDHPKWCFPVCFGLTEKLRGQLWSLASENCTSTRELGHVHGAPGSLPPIQGPKVKHFKPSGF